MISRLKMCKIKNSRKGNRVKEDLISKAVNTNNNEVSTDKKWNHIKTKLEKAAKDVTGLRENEIKNQLTTTKWTSNIEN